MRHKLPPEPATLKEAQAYCGRSFWKRFAVDGRQYLGTVKGVDGEVEVDSPHGTASVERGIFFRVHYPADGDEEHLLWSELAPLLVKAEEWDKQQSRRKRKGPATSAASAGEAGEPASAAPSAKRRKQHQLQQPDPASASSGQDAEERSPGTDVSGQADQVPVQARRGQQLQQQHHERPLSSRRQHSRQSCGRRQRPERAGSLGESAPAAEPALQQDDRGEVIPDSDPLEGDSAPHHQQQHQQQPSAKRRRTQSRAAAGASGQSDGEEGDGLHRLDEDFTREDLAAIEDILAASQQVAHVRTEGLAGQLRRVVVRDFMCHQNFSIDFGPHVNVISGQNGSGKSAVLQAMQCALGAKARQTGRGENMGQLVRSGCTKATVAVTLWNTGEDGFKHELYGDSITVERTFAAGSAGNSWKLLDAAGRKVSGSKRDVDELLDQLNIDATNPLAVMTQDTARNFLCGAVADKKKYALFMSATCLEDTREHLARAQSHVDRMDAFCAAMAAEQKARKDRVSQLEHRLRKLAKHGQLVEALQLYERAAAWATVREQQRRLAHNQRVLQQCGPASRAESQARLDEATARLEQLRAQEAEAMAAQEESDAHQARFVDELAELATGMRKAQLARKEHKKASDAAESALEALERELAQLLESQRESGNDRAHEHAAQLEAWKAQVEQAGAALAGADAAMKQAEAEAHIQREAMDAQQRAVQSLQRQQESEAQTASNMQRSLQQMLAAKGKRLALYGKHAELREAVDRYRSRFDCLPIGPLGAHLTLSSEQWAAAADVVLGGHLEKWVVHSLKDQQELRRIANNVGVRSLTVLVSRFDRPHYARLSQRALPDGWLSLRQFVSVDHPSHGHIIDNKLTDLTHYDCVVVDADEARCRDAAYSQAAGRGVRTVAHASGRHWEAKRGGTIVAHNFFQRGKVLLGSSVDSQRAALEQALVRAQAAAEEMRRALVAAHAQLRQLQADVEHASAEARMQLKRKMHASSRHQQLQARRPALQAPAADEDDEGDLLAESQRRLQEQLQAAQQARDAAKAELDAADEALERKRQLHDRRKAEVDSILEQVGSRTEELEQLARERRACLRTQEAAQESLLRLSRAEEELRRTNEVGQAALQVIEATAVQACGSAAAGEAALAQAHAQLKADFEAKLPPLVRQRMHKELGLPPDAELPGEHVAEYERRLAEQLAGAVHKYCVKEEVKTFEDLAKDTERQLRELEQSAGGSAADLESQLAKAKAEVRKHSRAVREALNVMHACTRQVQDRWTAYNSLFDEVNTTVSNKFMAYMHRRGHQGKVRVDRDAGELRLLVKINAATAGAEERKVHKAQKDLKQLSGGERSFTTVAFILALGEYTESPFRAMDEYDVFMDAVNRRIATQTLLEFAREKSHLQFVLLTPQDLQAIEDAKRHLAEQLRQALPESFVTVQRMKAARPGGPQAG